MNERWSLDVLYTGFDTPEFRQDFAKLEALTKEFPAWTATLGQADAAATVRAYLDHQEQLTACGNRMGVYCSLRQSADTGDNEARSWMGRIMALNSELAAADAAARQYIAALPELPELMQPGHGFDEYRYLLEQLRRNASHLLAPGEEAVLARMSLSGASAWSQLQETLTSTVEVPYRGGTETLSSIRNLAYNADAAVRREAYDAELAAYDKIRDGVAFSLNSIKLETITECKLRGFSSALDRSLNQSHMKQESLDALLEAIREGLPIFWRYLRLKGKALGHENGLPWWDLFAPMGGNGKTYTVEEARDYLLRIFGGFDGELRDMMARAFDESWIDFYPRAGKVGGAFCCEVYCAKQSRVLTNFGGEFGDIVTLAHELGHAFHNVMLFSHSELNLDLPMPLAETASTFNENVLVSEAIAASTDPQEKLALIESQLMDACQVICDIYSRFLFEKSVFDRRENEFLSPDALCDAMLSAQKTAYGDGLDQSALHPYMWACKSHYYSGGLSYYNFPYAFGGLFARSLYAMYREQGKSFVPKYKEMLRATTVMDAEDAAAIVGADLTDKSFWLRGLKSYEEEIDEFAALLGQ